MILQQLCTYYDRLANDPESGIAPIGRVVQPVAFCLVLDAKGTLLDIQDIRVTDGKKPRNRAMVLPGSPKPPGSGMNPTPNGWDRTDYMLGYLDPDSFKPEERIKKIARSSECHTAYRQMMLERRSIIDHPDYQAFCAFLEVWTPEQAEKYPVLKEMSGLFGIVRFTGDPIRYLHDLPALQTTIEEHSEAGKTMFCLVDGGARVVARTSTIKIKGVIGAQAAGAVLVGFNQASFESYGKEQSYNAPISEESAFKYATALNYLLERNSGHNVRVGDTSVVFWAERPSQGEDLFQFGLGGTLEEDESDVQKLEATFLAIREGRESTPDMEIGFHVLGLAPNAGRVAVRFWLSGTVGKMLQNIIRHQEELELIRSAKDRNHLPPWMVLVQTARESKEIPPLLGGAYLRSILTGAPYPQMLFSAVIRRIRADREIGHPRAAILKAILCRNFKKKGLIMLEPEREETPYQIGRLFAALEKAQEDALPGINATIKDRFFGAASATPGIIFPRLIRSSQHHIGKLDGGKKVATERRILEICGHISVFPTHMDLAGQGLFALGYYHQRQDFFKKKEKGEIKECIPAEQAENLET